MASYTVRQIEQCLLSKLQAVEEVSGHHRRFSIFDDTDQLVARTRLSHSFRGRTQLSDELLRQIRGQLHLNSRRDFENLVNCPLSRGGYLRIVLGGE